MESTVTGAEQPAVSLRGLRFGWGGPAPYSLSVETLEIPARARVLMLGKSGSGKSTLLSLICGLNPPQSGQVTVGGTDLAQLSGAARDRFRADRIGVIFQQFNLLPYATGLDNILLAAAVSSGRRRGLVAPRDEALRLCEALGLDADLVTRMPARALSVGQQQRVAAARALIGGPALVVADEPTSALDAESQARFLDLLFAQCADCGAALLMVSHDRGLSDRFDQVLELEEIAYTQRGAACSSVLQ